MKLYHLSQTERNDYETCDECVVCAESEEDAVEIHPEATATFKYPYAWGSFHWASTPTMVTARYIGEAAPDVPRGVVMASFNSA